VEVRSTFLGGGGRARGAQSLLWFVGDPRKKAGETSCICTFVVFFKIVQDRDNMTGDGGEGGRDGTEGTREAGEG
jgi:hypothetical protein